MYSTDGSDRSARLLANVEQTRELLARVGEGHWESWMGAARRELIAHDAHSLDRLLGAFGGMGSFNDLVVHPINGHNVTDAEAKAVNIELDRLRDALYEAATALRRSLK